jgi:hypothetical protein
LAQRGRGGGPRGRNAGRDRDDRERERGREHEREERELCDDPEEHHRVEKHRFVGSLPATPERYALAREQWSRLPGAVVRPSMNPPAPSTPQPPEPAQPGGKGPEQ